MNASLQDSAIIVDQTEIGKTTISVYLNDGGYTSTVNGKVVGIYNLTTNAIKFVFQTPEEADDVARRFINNDRTKRAQVWRTRAFTLNNTNNKQRKKEISTENNSSIPGEEYDNKGLPF